MPKLTKAGRASRLKYLLGGAALLVVIGGAGSAYVLAQTEQDPTSRARSLFNPCSDGSMPMTVMVKGKKVTRCRCQSGQVIAPGARCDATNGGKCPAGSIYVTFNASPDPKNTGDMRVQEACKCPDGLMVPVGSSCGGIKIDDGGVYPTIDDGGVYPTIDNKDNRKVNGGGSGQASPLPKKMN